VVDPCSKNEEMEKKKGQEKDERMKEWGKSR
jgi:hypothetical protein